MKNPVDTTNSAQDAEQEEDEKQTYEVQFSVKWVNFTLEDVEASSEEEAIEITLKQYEEDGLKAFTMTANNQEVTSLEGIFRLAKRWGQARAD